MSIQGAAPTYEYKYDYGVTTKNKNNGCYWGSLYIFYHSFL